MICLRIQAINIDDKTILPVYLLSELYLFLFSHVRKEIVVGSLLQSADSLATLADNWLVAAEWIYGALYCKRFVF